MPAAAEEVGIAITVRPQVRAYPLSGAPPWDLQEKEPIERGMRVKLVDQPPKAAFLKIGLTRAFGCQKINMEGQQGLAISSVLNLLGRSDAEVGNAADPCNPKLQLHVGRLRMAMLPGGERPIQIETPDATATVTGTYLRMLVDPAVGTFVAVDEGAVSVQAKAGGSAVVVKAGNWVLVPPGGLATRPAPLPPGDDDEILQDPPLLGCCDQTEPHKPPTDTDDGPP